jgi:hypothetical protein
MSMTDTNDERCKADTNEERCKPLAHVPGPSGIHSIPYSKDGGIATHLYNDETSALFNKFKFNKRTGS